MRNRKYSLHVELFFTAFDTDGTEETLLKLILPPLLQACMCRLLSRDLQKLNLRFTENPQHWSAGFLSCVSNIVSSSREVDKFSLFEYANLSHVLEDTMIEGHHALMKMKN
ncbi:hypothetical protein V6N13_106204 [Hibiscus sabdariffa]